MGHVQTKPKPMKTEIQSAAAAVATQTVRATINERNLFVTMKQWFASSFSFLGETMQNSRRAGATFVKFDLATPAEGELTLTITDDGCGIEDFQVLLHLAESGWDNEQLVLSEKPFGIGLFSLFYACERVTFSSRGQSVTVCLNDIEQRRELQVKADPEAPVVGTRITLHNPVKEVAKDALPIDPKHPLKSKIQTELEVRAKGFAIPVWFCGLQLDRPHAVDTLNFTESGVGKLWIRGVDSESEMVGSVAARYVQMYLQGLPIEDNHNRWANEPIHCIVHLDSQKFIPVMPDRARLQDGENQRNQVYQALQQHSDAFIVAEKHRMAGEEFLKKHYQHIKDRSNLSYLLNDIPFLPKSSFDTVESVAYDTSEVYSSPRDASEMTLFTRQALLDEGTTVFVNAPDGPHDFTWAAALLKVMQREEVMAMTDKLDKGHWIFEIAHDVNDLTMQFEVVNPVGDEPVDADNYCCRVALMDRAEITLRSSVKPGWALQHTIENDWVVVPDLFDEDTKLTFEDQDFDEVDFRCFMCKKDKSCDSPWYVFSGFVYDDRHDQNAEDNARIQWETVIRGLLGSGINDAVETALARSSVEVIDTQAKDFVLVKTERRFRPRGNRFDFARPAFYVESIANVEFWNKVAAELLTSPGKVDGESLLQAFIKVTKPGEYVPSMSEAADLSQLAGLERSHDKGRGWFVVNTRGAEVNFGAYQDEAQASCEMHDYVVSKAIATAANGRDPMTREQWKALDFKTKTDMVKAAFPWEAEVIA